MKKADLHRTIHVGLSCGIAFLISFKFLLPILIGALLVNIIAEGKFKSKWDTAGEKPFLILFSSIYFLYLVGMIYSTNSNYGWADLQTKLSLLLFPFIFFFQRTRETDSIKIKLSLILGVAFASIFLLARAIYFYFSKDVNYFFYVDFSYFLHPSYFGMAINLAMILLLFKNNFPLSRFVQVSLILFFTLILILLSSKLALISTIMLFIVFAIQKIIQTKKYFIGISATILILGSALIALSKVPELNERVKNAIAALDTSQIDKSNAESNAVRILVWDAAAKALAENPIAGVGTGDVKDELFKQYQILGYTGALEHQLNAHNQFLQTGVALGFPGLLLLLSGLLLPSLYAFKKNNFVFLAFAALVAINFLTESMLEAEAGVIFIAFFHSFLFFTPTKELLNFTQKNI